MNEHLFPLGRRSMVTLFIRRYCGQNVNWKIVGDYLVFKISYLILLAG